MGSIKKKNISLKKRRKSIQLGDKNPLKLGRGQWLKGFKTFKEGDGEDKVLTKRKAEGLHQVVFEFEG